MVTRRLKRGDQFITVRVNRYFRRFIQRVGSQTIYFKEFGDPRKLNSTTGRYGSGPEATRATEIIHLSLWSGTDAYGVPRWIGQLPSVLGTREAELTNLQFFRDNAVPAMAVLVGGGSLTQESLDAISSMFERKRGRESMNRVMVLEAMGSLETAPENGQIPAPRMELRPLSDDRQSDALFSMYEENGYKKIRSSFRLPPLFVGLSEDTTYASAGASLTMTEAQVFSPERNRSDEIFQDKILVDFETDVPYWRFRSNPTRLVNPESVTKAVSEYEKVGAMTPNLAIQFMNETFGTKVPAIMEEWADVPWLLSQKMLGIDSGNQPSPDDQDDSDEDEDEGGGNDGI